MLEQSWTVVGRRCWKLDQSLVAGFVTFVGAGAAVGVGAVVGVGVVVGVGPASSRCCCSGWCWYS